jgi:hypothetical protein
MSTANLIDEARWGHQAIAVLVLAVNKTASAIERGEVLSIT